MYNHSNKPTSQHNHTSILHFNQAGHSINDVRLIPIELIRSKRDSVRKVQEAHLTDKQSQNITSL